MTSNASSLRVMPIQGTVAETTEADTVAEVPEAIIMTITDAENSPTFSYSATSEDNLNQTAEADYVGSLDGQPGITYNGPSGMTNHLRFACDTLKVLEGPIAPADTDTIVPALYVNSDLRAFFDTEDARAANGGFASEVDTGIAVEYHIDTIVHVNEGDVIRVAVLGGTEETLEWDIDDEANFFIS